MNINGMTKDQIRKFIKRVAPKDWKIEVSFFTDESKFAYGAIMYVNDCNEGFLNMNTDLSKGRDPKALLLHEVGHCCGEDNHNPSMVKREVSAQEWAIKRAGELGMSKLQKDLKWEIEVRWGNKFKGKDLVKYEWNSG